MLERFESGTGKSGQEYVEWKPVHRRLRNEKPMQRRGVRLSDIIGSRLATNQCWL